MRLVVDQERQRIERKPRKPNFPIAGQIFPYALTPIWFHPVLPGETMKSCTIRNVRISQPVQNPIEGVWFEDWIFYVKLTDIDKSLGDQFMRDGESQSGWTASSDQNRFFVKNGQINWFKHCYDKIVEDYFTDEGETVPTIDQLAQLKLNNSSWYNNLIFEPADTAIPTDDARNTYEELTKWAMLQMMEMTEIGYEEHLEQYGVRSVEPIDGKCEVLRYARKWTRPTNAVDPSSGSPSSAWYCGDDIKADKDKRFTEPGFIVHLSAIRPKMYNNTLWGVSMANELWGLQDWFPPALLDDPTAGVRELDLATRNRVYPADKTTPASTKSLIYDHRDLLSHGETFINTQQSDLPYRLPVATGMSALDTADNAELQNKYCSTQDVKDLFVGDGVDKWRVQYGGMASLTVLGHVKDTIK